MNPRTAVVLGASGMVGGFCLKALLAVEEFSRVLVLTRRELALPAHPKLSQTVVDFEKLIDRYSAVKPNAGNPAATDLSFDDPSADNPFAGADTIFCALGTTIRKAGTQEAFLRVDLQLPLAAAKMGITAGTKQFVVVSSAGADAASKNFYLHTKGELEQRLGELGYESLPIFRPGLLLGKREEVRPGELLATRIAPFINLTLWGPLRHYRSISAETVGKAMVAAATQGKTGTNIYEYDQIRKLGV